MGNHWCCCACVESDELVAVEKFGEFKHIGEPGFHCLPCGPCMWNITDAQSTRVRQLTVPCETKSRDHVTLQLTCELIYELDRENPYQAFYRVSLLDSQLEHYVQNIIRSKIPTMKLDDIFTDLISIRDDMQERLSGVLKSFGLRLLHALIVDIQPHQKVVNSMNEIQVETRLRVAASDKAEAMKIATIKHGEATAEEKRLDGMGIAYMRKAIVDGLRESISGLSDSTGITRQQVMDLVLITQYFDYLSEVGGGRFSNKSDKAPGEINFMYHNPAAMSNMRDVMHSIINGQMRDTVATNRKK